MHSIKSLDTRKSYYDFTDIEKDETFLNLCQYSGVEATKFIIDLEKMNTMKQLKHYAFCNNSFENVNDYIKILLGFGKYKFELNQLRETFDKYNYQISSIDKTTNLKIQILHSRGLKNHSIHLMTPESKLKHVRSCDACNNISKFSLLTDEEILTNKINTDKEINDLRTKVEKIKLQMDELHKKINIIKPTSVKFTKHIMNTYLKYKIYVKDNDKQNDKITFCVDIGDVVVEVPFSEIIARAIGEYAKGEFQKKI